MNVQIECMEPRLAKQIVGGLFGGCCIFQIQGDDCFEVKHWLEEQTVNLNWIVLVEESKLEAIYVAFPLLEQTDPEVRAINDTYMLFKMSWKGREGVLWNDQHYVPCKIRTFGNNQAAQ